MSARQPQAPGRSATITRAIATLSNIFLRPIASILMLRSPYLGLALWGVLFVQPLLAVAALAAATTSEALGWVADRLFEEKFGLVERVNNLLVGLIIGWLLLPLQPSLTMIALVLVTAQMLSTVITIFVRRLLDSRGLPVLILPYALVALGLFTLMPLAVHNAVLAAEWPALISENVAEIPLNLLRALGVIVLSPWEYAGIAVLLVVFINAPVSLLAGVLGWAGGVAMALGLLHFGVFFHWEVTSYNFFLAGVAVFSAFFVPSRGSFLMTPFAGALAAVVAAFLQNFLLVPGLSVLPIPFLIASYMLVVVFERGPLRPDMDWLTSPADKWLRFSWHQRRWGKPGTPLLALPVNIAVRITQGFDARISHRGDWCHALDFEGLARATPQLHGIWGAHVFAPVNGIVADIRDNVPDNPLGTANHSENWGNLAVIRSDEDFHVLLAHLLPGSVSVSPGQRVGFSTIIGKVGNSGRSYVPHLHMQAQRQDFPGAPTIDFRLANYLELDSETAMPKRWCAASVPREGDAIAAAAMQPQVHDLLSSMLAGQSIWSVSVHGDVPYWAQPRQPLVTRTTITPQGTFEIRCGTDYLELRPDIDGWRVIDMCAAPASLIATLSAAMATIPNCASPGLEWADVLPRPQAGLIDRLFCAVLPFSENRLAMVALRCDTTPDDYSPTLKLSAQVYGRGADAINLCRVELASKKGPVSAEFIGKGFSLTFIAMTFDVAQA